MSTETLPTIHGYKLLRPLGRGSYGSVWEARGSGGFPAALKFISLAHSGMLAEPELKALQESKELNHPHLIQTREVFPEGKPGEDDEWVIIVMEFAAGTLRERLVHCRQNGMKGIPQDELLHYMRQAADALDYLHGQNKLHRDIKPDNLLISSVDSPHIKVGDCGLLRDRDRMGTMAAQGSPPYISPEAWIAQTVPASDQFSLAASYVELRLGRLPFDGANAAELSINIQFMDPNLEGMEAAEQEVVKVALAKSPGDRFPMCRDFVSALETSLATSATTYRAKGKIGLVKKDVRLSPPQVKGASFKPQTMPMIDVQSSTALPPPPPMSSAPPVAAPAVAPPPAAPAPVVNATMPGGTDRTLGAPPAAPAAPATPRPVVTKTIVPKRDEVIESGDWVPIDDVPDTLKPGAAVQAPPSRRPPGLGVGAVVAAVLIVTGLVGVGYLAWVNGLFENPGKNNPIAEAKDGKAKDVPAKEKDVVTEKEKERKDEKGVVKKEKDKDRADGDPPPPPVAFMPEGCRRAEGAKDEQVGDKLYVSRVVKQKGTEDVVFLLMKPAKGGPFYIMEDKVWNKLYTAFAAERDSETGPSWQSGALAGAADRGDEFWPAVRMKRSEAEACARWLGGRLPSCDDLDHAAGVFDDRMDRPGPAVGRPLAVGRRAMGPMAVGSKDKDKKPSDVSPLGVRDLSSNGREWTSDKLMAGDREVAVLRGQSYTAQGPLTYKDLDEMRDPAMAATQYPDVPSPYTGFRVVLEVK